MQARQTPLRTPLWTRYRSSRAPPSTTTPVSTAEPEGVPGEAPPRDLISWSVGAEGVRRRRQGYLCEQDGLRQPHRVRPLLEVRATTPCRAAPAH